MDNKNQPNDNSSQNELDLGFNHSDSVTPRKPVQQSGSIFDKAKGLFGKKEQPDTQFHVRREPTFGAAASQPFSPSQAFQSENTEQSAPSSAFGTQEPVENVQVENVAEEKVIFENSPAEEIVEEVTTQAETVAPAAAAAASLKSPESSTNVTRKTSPFIYCYFGFSGITDHFLHPKTKLRYGGVF